jgi:hypothetical protein
MKKYLTITIVVILIGSTSLVASAYDPNSLEIVICQFAGDGTFEYNILMSTSKVDAVTCQLVILTGTYTLTDEGHGAFLPGPDYYKDTSLLTFEDLTGIIGVDWTLTWDEGLPTETIATISFGTVAANDFLLMPTITNPVSGGVIANPDPNPPVFTWTYAPTPPCQAQLEGVFVYLQDPEGVGNFYPPADCNTTSWTPPEPLSEGDWLFMVFNVCSIRDVPDGLQVTGDPWILDNSDWLALFSIGESQCEVVPTSSLSWGGVKVLYGD